MEAHGSETRSDLLLGIDIGTTNCKVAVGDRDGRIIHASTIPCRLQTPGPGRVEVDPDTGWWEPLLECLNTVLSYSGVDPEAIRGIGVSCTNALVCLNGSGRPVRNAIMQIDRRAEPICREIEESIGGEEIRGITGNRVAPGTCSAPSLLWIRNEEPHRFREIDTILSPAGYIVHRLTGRRSMDRTRAATTLLYDIRNGTWSERMLEMLELPDRLLPTILSPCDVAGEISDEAARQTGLKAGIPVIAGAMDSIAAAVGMGTTRPGEIGIVLGTVGRILWPLEGPTFDDRFINTPLTEPDRWMSVACMNGTGLSIHWFVANLIAPGEFSNPGDHLDLFDAESAGSPPGSRGILYLPYLSGERSPIWDSRARGVFFGLDRSHRRGDLGRSVMEGTAFSIRENLEILESVTGTVPGSIRLSGGGSRSPVWPGILSSVLNREIEISVRDDSECSGALILAGKGVGTNDRERTISRSATDGNRRISPDPAAVTIYDELYRHYRELYLSLSPHFHRMDDTMSEHDHEEEKIT